ncbi:unnamed protein product [Prunus armeniaca]|uniref:Uncharacterized protein n=1 Tax=Prunus armeniaca TaxID=36596 RepID=A0A6J5UUK8_PRUAR|nr:unnamed protein product [Prunus armeniaca]
MALELVEGAVLGTVFAALHDVVKVALVQTPPWRSQVHSRLAKTTDHPTNRRT